MILFERLQKLVALKKAYADIILNTVKEAAARVMVSERKVRCLQQDLTSVKDEALRMLLRLKNMIDSKVIFLSILFTFVFLFLIHSLNSLIHYRCVNCCAFLNSINGSCG